VLRSIACSRQRPYPAVSWNVYARSEGVVVGVGGDAAVDGQPLHRGLHSSTFRINVSTFCRIGGAFMGGLGGV